MEWKSLKTGKRRTKKAMMITIVGCRPYDFVDETTKRQVSGLSAYYTAEGAATDGVKGQIAAKLSVKVDSDLYRRLLNANYSEPFLAETHFDMVPGSNRAVLNDIVF